MNGTNGKKGITRRKFIKTTAALGAATGLSSLGFPAIIRAEPKEIIIGHIHPLSGFLAFDGKGMENGLKQAVEEVKHKVGHLLGQPGGGDEVLELVEELLQLLVLVAAKENAVSDPRKVPCLALHVLGAEG